MKKLFCLCIAFTLWGGVSFAGTLTGRAVFSDGTPVVGALFAVNNVVVGWTDSNGVFNFVFTSSGTYTVQVFVTGYSGEKTYPVYPGQEDWDFGTTSDTLTVEPMSSMSFGVGSELYTLTLPDYGNAILGKNEGTLLT